MQSRAKDFQLPVRGQPIKTEVAPVKVEKPDKKDAKPTIKVLHKVQHKIHRRWRNIFTSKTVCLFCVDCWMSSKRKFVRRRKNRMNATMFKKKISRKCIASPGQRTGETFIDNIFSLIK